MIKIKDYKFDGGAIKFTVEYDYKDKTEKLEGTTSINTIVNMTVDQIKSWVRNKVNWKRQQYAKNEVDEILQPLIDMDIEEVEE